MIIEKIIYYYYECHSRLKRFLYNLHPNISIGKGTTIGPGCVIRCQYGGSISIGINCTISSGAQILTHGGHIRIGNNTSVNPYTIVYGQGNTTIGDNVRIAAQCCIIPSNHIFTDINTPIYLQGLSKKGILIEDDVWLGAGVKVLVGVIIRKGSIIGSNAVVTKSTNQYSVCVGIPAKEIKNRKL